MNKFIIASIFLNAGCAGIEVLNLKKELSVCKVENISKDTIVNKLYKTLKIKNRKLKKDDNVCLTQLDKLTSRLKLCRKELLDCRVNRSRHIEYNLLLKKHIESELCDGNK